MSANLLRVCSIMAEDYFGKTVKQVVESLILLGPVRLPNIVTHSKVRLSDAKEALKILFQHNMLGFEVHEGFEQPFYRFDYEAALFLARIPQLLAITEKVLGIECRQVVDEITKAGQITISKLFYILGYKFRKANPEASDDNLFQQLCVFRAALKRTIERKLVCPCPRLISSPNSPIPEFSALKPDVLEFPKVDLRALCDKIKTSDNNLQMFPDTVQSWRIDMDQFQAEFKNDLLIAAVHLRSKQLVDSNIFRALLELGTKDDLYPINSLPIPVVEVHARLTKTLAAPPTLERVKEQLEVLEEDSLRIITKYSTSGHGSYTVHVMDTFVQLVWATIERTISEKYGFFASRIFRIIRELKYVEQDKINEVSMIPGKNAKQLTYLMVENNFIKLKEIRKSYAASSAGHKPTVVFHVDMDHIVNTLVETCYKAIINSRLRIRVENNRQARLVAKEERIERILANMINNKCSEEALKEIRDLITPPEQAVLAKHKAIVHKLASAHLHADHTLFVLQVYLYFKSLG